ncbi:Rgg family transcriptional regulator [Facklamia languida]
MWVGRAFKNARESKGMSQREAAHKILSIASLSKFENGFTIISADKFIRLLDRIRMSYFEFYHFFLEEEDCSQSMFILNLRKASHSKNTFQLNRLIKNEFNYLKHDHNIRHEHNIILAKETIHLVNKQPINRKNMFKIYDFLFSVPDWGEYELILFENAIFGFTMKQIISLSDEAIKKAYAYKNSIRFRLLLVQILQNIISMTIRNGNNRISQKRLKEVNNLLEGTNFIDEKINQKYLFGLHYIYNREIDKGVKLCKTAINDYSDFEMFNYANQLERELSEIIKEK